MLKLKISRYIYYLHESHLGCEQGYLVTHQFVIQWFFNEFLLFMQQYANEILVKVGYIYLQAMTIYITISIF